LVALHCLSGALFVLVKIIRRTEKGSTTAATSSPSLRDRFDSTQKAGMASRMSNTSNTSPARVAPSRLISLDVFRGATIGAMVLVNNPGTWSAVYPPLLHAEWHGWTFTDTIFPFFIFIMGIAIPIALERRRSAGQVGTELYLKLLRRGAALFGLGLFLAIFPFYNWMKGEWIGLSDLRIMGVLQRLGLCYFFASILFLWLKPRGLLIAAFALLLFYWAAMALGGDYSPEGNFSGAVDRAILGPHMWKGSEFFDPEGLFSTIPSIATCIFGVLTGQLIMSRKSNDAKVAEMFFWGFVLLAIGWMWSAFFPINKPIWSSSYSVFMSGLAMCVLAACYWLIDIKGSTWWTKPFVIFGVNALALFVGSGMLGRILNMVPGGVAPDGKLLSLKTVAFDGVFAPLASPMNASLMFAVLYIGLWLFLMWLLYRKNIFIKV
jgi:predicted acyltransferase